MPRIEELDPDEELPLTTGGPRTAPPTGGMGGPGGMPNMEALAQMMQQMRESGQMPPGMGGMGGMGGPAPKAKDDSRYRHWATIYPIYLDAKAPHCHGGRRVNKERALRWPLAWMMAQACKRLGFPCELEEEKTHPADWRNPGRVKVCMKKNDKPLHRTIKTKYQLLCAISAELLPVEERRLGPRGKKGPLAPVHVRLPPLSPAVSHGVLDNAAGGGLDGMMQAMGMGPSPEAAEALKLEDKGSKKPKKRR